MSTFTSKMQVATAVFAVAATATLTPVALADDTDATSSDTTGTSVGGAAGQAPTRSTRKDRPLPTSQAGGSQSTPTDSTSGAAAPSTDNTSTATPDRASTDVAVPDSKAATSNAVGANPLFQNPLIWIGQPNPNPPTSSTIYEFQPLSNLPEFTRPMFGWMDNFAFEACALGLGTTVRGQNLIGPYGTSITSVGTSGCA